MRYCALLCLVSIPAAEAAVPIPQVANPKAARTATLVYEIGEADVYYMEAIIQKTTDGSFFMACGWDNGYFGLQQYVGENQRSVVFAMWNGAEDDEPGADKAFGPVQILDWTAGGKTNAYGGDKLGAQYMRQIPWRVGETNRFAIDAVRSGAKTSYTAWLGRPGSDWEKLATFRAYSGFKWLRGYNSFVEDFRRDTKSANETRRALFSNIWIHQYRGAWIPVTEVTYATSGSRYEAGDKVDAGDEEGGFFLSTGGDTIKHRKSGARIHLPSVPFRQPEPPVLTFLKQDKPQP
jgi:hypothetical protein